MDNNNIYGEYCFEILFQNMFNTYQYTTKRYKNIITETGITFLLNRLFDNNYNIYSVAHGTGTNKATKNDTELEEKTYENIEINYIINGNTLELKTESQGYNIKNTTEIGVYYISPNGTQLISRNTHEAMELPDTSYITVRYYYVLSTAEYVPNWTLTENTTSTYETDLEYVPNYIVEADTNNGYHKLEEITDIDSTNGSYYYDSTENKLYIHCSGSESPTTHQILINY